VTQAAAPNSSDALHEDEGFATLTTSPSNSAMAANLPAKLKTAGIQPFANRATQLEKYRPIVWYWVCSPYHPPSSAQLADAV